MREKRDIMAVILAAGKGTRMKSDLPKVLHPLMGQPMVSYVLDACRKAGVSRTILVIGHQANQVRETLGSEFEYVEQKEQLGTGHALMMAAPLLKNVKADILVLAGDTPFLTADILKKLIRKQQKTGAEATMLTANMDPAGAYGRIIRDTRGKITSIVEARDATPEQLKIIEVNTSHYCFRAESVIPLLKKLETNNDQGEYYLTDIIHMLASKNKRIESITSNDPNVLMGINNRAHLSEAHTILRDQLIEGWSEKGVTFIDPQQVTIEPDVRIGNDTLIYPGTLLTGNTVIGKGCKIGPQVRITDSKIGDGCHIEFSVLENRKIEKDATVGPFAYLSTRLTDE
ncbi:bifunctional UDP-N-acetylglucosamine diphosphorylase/glucosamine-1-phosphate N-acetyltransferase GlmU [candidate division KSB1 bacterium]|nr:bifunctional UDP-N-acetylglucosamine diphosphorylase/glucosamine-1-phosphate N-acetyltransferase GlmU [candidate division KSB1 bacterium]